MIEFVGVLFTQTPFLFFLLLLDERYYVITRWEGFLGL